MTYGTTTFIENHIDLFCCPYCNGDLVFSNEGLNCRECQKAFPDNQGIPCLFCPNEWEAAKEDITDTMQSFYEETPFPDYDDFDNTGSLIEKARKSLFAKLLDDQIPTGTRILECGCGTGQLTNYLSIAYRTVVGTDMCLNSLKLANDFKQKNKLDRAHFFQMNLFRPFFKPESFDLVISNGVLHHTSDPRLAFQSISRLVKPGGYIMIGLYHKYGRLFTDLRRIIFNVTRKRYHFLDARIKNSRNGNAKSLSWFMDQYKNPHESKHTAGEVLPWLDDNNFTFIHSVPKTTPFSRISNSEKLFMKDRIGNRFERFISDIGCILDGHNEGGFFTVIARKNKAS
ncbi:MAG: methyltransferase domain-containing protein [Desulfobacter sp.]